MLWGQRVGQRWGLGGGGALRAQWHGAAQDHMHVRLCVYECVYFVLCVFKRACLSVCVHVCVCVFAGN